MKGQIIKILSNLYTVCDENGNLYDCHSRGRFRNDNITPTVGDYVVFDDKNNYILEILDRKNTLDRPLVSNIDQAIIVTSCKKPDLELNLLDKLLVVLEYNNIDPIICLTKLDLLSKDELTEIDNIRKYYQYIGYTILDNTQIDELKEKLNKKTTVLTGQTGAGKSSLINKLDPNFNLATGEISKALGRGKHTTRHVELIEMFGGKVLDTPGFSSIDLKEMTKEDIKDAFIEFNEYPCPYKDCMHINEKECSVKQAVEDNNILESRYENYKKFIEMINNRR